MHPGTVVADKYRVERVIGRGGMGFVVEATHLQLETRVALKFLAHEMASDPTAVARFTREARACAQLKNEHICRVTDFGVDGAVPYIVMELLSGTDLARLSKVRPIDVARAALYIQQACAGLAEAHAAKIIHRDLKPGNLFLTRRADGTPLIKVLDFGVAKAPVGADDVALTAATTAVGSPGFMSPEQFRSSRTVDGRSDIWSLGVILYKLVANRLPFPVDGFAEFVRAISSDPTPALPEAPPQFEAIVARCLEKDPARRFPDVGALAEALAPFAAQARDSAPVAPVAAAPVAAAPVAATKTLLGTPSPVEPMTAPVAARMPPTVAGTEVPSRLVAGAAPAELVTGSFVGEYQIEKKIGQGGMGVVYSAIHPLIGKKAAIKVISGDLGTDPVVVQRFVQEARSVNQIGHPNIVDVFAFGNLPDGRNYFVMEHLQGESLRARITYSFLSLADAIQILDEIAGALEAAHEQGIVHRDLKPDNVFLATVRGHQIMVKLLDFGIAKLAAGEGAGLAKTHTGELIGTPAYLSPEQARGKNVDYRSDIYALGCMMFEIITGRLPFIADSTMDVVLMHLTTVPQRASELRPEIPPPLDHLIWRMMDKDPDARPTLAEVRDVFAELVASGLVAIEPGSGSTFRSELARGHTGARNRPATGTPPVRPSTGPMTTARRRSAASSEAPTSIAFTPGPDTITPSAAPAPTAGTKPTSRRGLVVAIVAAAFLVPIGSVLIATLTKSGRTAPADAAGAASVSPAAAAGGSSSVVDPPAVPADAATAAVVPPTAPTATADAGPVLAAPPQREVEIRVNLPAARIELDGVVVASPGGIAKPSLGDGPHQLAITAKGRVRIERTIEVSNTMKRFDILLERAAPTATSTGGERPASDPKRPKKSDHTADYTIDPFAP